VTKEPGGAAGGRHAPHPAGGDIAGIRALVVHAEDEKAWRFYEHFNFDASPKDPLHLSILIKEIRRQMADAP
jgi:hypothetical protein